jgi:hypothetical protein
MSAIAELENSRNSVDEYSCIEFVNIVMRYVGDIPRKKTEVEG